MTRDEFQKAATRCGDFRDVSTRIERFESFLKNLRESKAIIDISVFLSMSGGVSEIRKIGTQILDNDRSKDVATGMPPMPLRDLIEMAVVQHITALKEKLASI